MVFDSSILLNYDIGCAKHRNLESQVYVLTHELTHVYGIRDYPGHVHDWYRCYLQKSGFRAMEESRPNAAVNELKHWSSRVLDTTAPDGYMFDKVSKDLYVTAARAHAEQIADEPRGVCYHKASRLVIDKLKSMGYTG